MKTKRPSAVLHEADALDAYMSSYLSDNDISFESWIKRFDGGLYKSRNEKIVEFLREFSCRKVLEFACAGPFLADNIMREMADIESYVCSNFSKDVIDYCRSYISSDRRFRTKLIDADVSRSTDMHRHNIADFDTFITTSLEHIQFDREMIKEMPTGSILVFSVALFDDPEHFHVFSSVRDVKRRYRGLLRIVRTWQDPTGSKIAVAAIREDSATIKQRLFRRFARND